MNINRVRIANILLAAIMLLAGQYNYLWYIGAMHLSLEVLNRQNVYLLHAYKIYNFIFWSYELVLLERLRTAHLSALTEWLLNCAEHLAFGVVICLKIYIYTAVFSKGKVRSRWQRALIAFVVFNMIGVVNEIFQNNLAHRNLFVFIADSIKDIKMNLLGAVVFFAAVLWRLKVSGRKLRA